MDREPEDKLRERIFARLDTQLGPVPPPIDAAAIVARNPALAVHRKKLAGADAESLLQVLLLVDDFGWSTEIPADIASPILAVGRLVEEWLYRHAAQHRAMRQRISSNATLQ